MTFTPKALSFIKTIVLKIWRMSLILILLLGACTYPLWSKPMIKRMEDRSSSSQVNRLLAEQEKTNPVLASKIKDIRHTYGDLPIQGKLQMDAAATKEAFSENTFLQQLEYDEPTHEIQLIALARDTGMDPKNPALENFLINYDSFLRILPEMELRSSLLSHLREAARSKYDWKYVQQGSCALLIWIVTQKTPYLWEFFKDESEWFLDVFTITLSLQITTLYDAGINLSYEDVLMAASKLIETGYEFRDKLKSMPSEEAIASFHVFQTHGDLLKLIIRNGQLPFQESFEVLYTNPEIFEDSSLDTNKQLHILSTVHKENAAVWESARNIPFALQFYLDVGSQANTVLERYESNPGLVLQIYEHYGHDKDKALLKGATKALVDYEDVAAYMLFEYRDNPDFNKALVDDRVGSRIIPFLARFPDRLQDVIINPGWVDKYFDQSGKEKDHDRWWEVLIPGGSIAKIVSNWKNGYPSEWKELGWALFDTVDIGLVVFTVGTANVFSSTAKGATKATTRISANMLKFGGKTLGKIGAKVSTRAAGKILIRTSRALNTASRAILRHGDTMAKIFARTGKITKQSVKQLKRVGYGMMIAKVCIRWETVKKLPQQLGETLGILAADVIKAAPVAVSAMLAKIVEELLGSQTYWYRPIMHIAPPLLLVAVCFYLFRGRNKQSSVQYLPKSHA